MNSGKIENIMRKSLLIVLSLGAMWMIAACGSAEVSEDESDAGVEDVVVTTEASVTEETVVAEAEEVESRFEYVVSGAREATIDTRGNIACVTDISPPPALVVSKWDITEFDDTLIIFLPYMPEVGEMELLNFASDYDARIGEGEVGMVYNEMFASSEPEYYSRTGMGTFTVEESGDGQNDPFRATFEVELTNPENGEIITVSGAIDGTVSDFGNDDACIENYQ